MAGVSAGFAGISGRFPGTSGKSPEASGAFLRRPAGRCSPAFYVEKRLGSAAAAASASPQLVELFADVQGLLAEGRLFAQRARGHIDHRAHQVHEPGGSLLVVGGGGLERPFGGFLRVFGGHAVLLIGVERSDHGGRGGALGGEGRVVGIDELLELHDGAEEFVGFVVGHDERLLLARLSAGPRGDAPAGLRAAMSRAAAAYARDELCQASRHREVWRRALG